MKSLFSNRRGQVVFALVFFFTAIIIIFLTAFIAPFGAFFTQEMYIAGEGLINQSQVRVNDIQDVAIRDSVTDLFASAQSSTVANIEISTGLYKYSGVILVVIVALVLFLLTRRSVEFGRVG